MSSDQLLSAESWEEMLRILETDRKRLEQGGGARAIERQQRKGRLTVRQRLVGLIDPDTDFFELGLYAADQMYQEWGGAPAAGVVTGVGRVKGRHFMIVANDATVKGGAFFPMTAKKVLRAQRVALDNRLPLIYLVDSAGVFLPLQEEVFPDEDDFGRIFRHNARLSALGVPQIAAIMGPCVAGGAYLPVMCDKILMTEGSGLYIAGPSLVKAAIGQDLESDQLGGAELHSKLSGTVDFREKDDESCLDKIRQLAGRMGGPAPSPFKRGEAKPPHYAPEEIYEKMPAQPQPYPVREVLSCILDRDSWVEYKLEYGRTLVCGYARVGGFEVGVVANEKLQIREPGKPIEMGGVLYPESADKGARFVMDCNQNRLPLLFFHDVNGFMVGRNAELSGIIKSGAKLVNAVSNSVVPKITVIMGGSYGAGNYALCGKAYDPRLVLAWPTCRYAVMGGEQAARTLTDLRVRQLKKEGKAVRKEQREQIMAEISEQYTAQTDPRFAAARLWVDRILPPHLTREALILALEVASLNPNLPSFRTGVLQV